MSREAPPSRAQKQGGMLQPVIRSVLDANDLGGGSPEFAVPLCSANEVFLVVDGAEEDIPADACEEDDSCLEIRPEDRISSKVLCLKSIHTW